MDRKPQSNLCLTTENNSAKRSNRKQQNCYSNNQQAIGSGKVTPSELHAHFCKSKAWTWRRIWMVEAIIHRAGGPPLMRFQCFIPCEFSSREKIHVNMSTELDYIVRTTLICSASAIDATESRQGEENGICSKYADHWLSFRHNENIMLKVKFIT
ncbi:hypothetical protein GUJ93_ZPchr0009g843 [Zizania palustris]|uniref:Uncharacterized protein n=1 Tax=Zizania palustris TaxID=103762 RepID=A0A8J5RMG5_ZIZPA|nr:hypothetical protein GUJ93_ZPchr0009g843 [Zizania palustris]